MFKKILPKEEKYFDDFKEMISLIHEMSVITHQLFSGEQMDYSLILKIKSLEKRCDEISSRVTKRLNKTYITPIDREDIFALIKKLDNIADTLLAASVRVEVFQITEKIENADKLTEIVVQQIKELDVILADLKTRERFNECKAVKDLETEADNVYRATVTKLFCEETNAVVLIKKKELLDILENAADKCQSTANVIMSIFIKNS